MLRLVQKYTFIEAELDEGLQEYRPPFGQKTEVQCYVNDYTPQSIMPRACRDYQPYPVDLPLSSQKRRNLDLQEESGLEDEKSSRTTEEEVERPQQPFKRSR